MGLFIQGIYSQNVVEKNCGITTNIDGTENREVNIRGLDGYIIPLPEEEFHLETSKDYDDETDSGA